MLRFDGDSARLEGAKGSLLLRDDDQVTRRIAMLFEGECEAAGPLAAARKFGLSKQRYYQLLRQFTERGAEGLLPGKRGPKQTYRRTEEVVRQVIRYRFLDPDASADVIAQKLVQNGWEISVRSVQRVIEEFGLQKKTLFVPARRSLREGPALKQKTTPGTL